MSSYPLFTEAGWWWTGGHRCWCQERLQGVSRCHGVSDGVATVVLTVFVPVIFNGCITSYNSCPHFALSCFNPNCTKCLELSCYVPEYMRIYYLSILTSLIIRKCYHFAPAQPLLPVRNQRRKLIIVILSSHRSVSFIVIASSSIC